MMNSSIVVFSCNWDGWSCIDAAANAGLPYPVNVHVVRLPCLSAVDAGLILRAFEYGASGVLLLGCLPHHCRHGHAGEKVEGELKKSRALLKLLGRTPDSARLAQLEAFDGPGFIELVSSFASSLAAGLRP